MENPILGGGYTCNECGKYQRTSALCDHSNLIFDNTKNKLPSKEEFYKYGESLGIKINDLQRLKVLACNEPFDNFYLRLKNFVSNVQVNDPMSEEEKEMIISVCNRQINKKN